MSGVRFIGYNPGIGTGHTHGIPDLAGWQDTYQKIGPGATSSAASGAPFATCTKLFDTAIGYPNFPTSWTGIAPTLVANNGGIKLTPIFVFGSGPPAPQPPSVAAIVAFLTSMRNSAPPGQTAAFNFISEVEAGGDGISPSQYLTNWGITSNNLNQALAQMGGPPFYTRANFPFITASRMDFYLANANGPISTLTQWLPPPSQVDSYGADFYTRAGGTNTPGPASSDPRFQAWVRAVHAVAGANVSMSFPEYGIGFASGAYTAANEATRARNLAADFAYMTGSSSPAGSGGIMFWMYWYQMDTNQSPANIYCFPLAGGLETQSQAIATISQWQSMVSGGPPPGNTITVTNPGTQHITAGNPASLTIVATDSNPLLSLTYTAANLPPNLTIGAASGQISGTATTPGTYQVSVTVTDGTGAVGSATFTWVVDPSTRVVVTVNNPGPQATTLNGVASLQITASDTAGNPLTFSASGLPTGLTISSSGLVSGTATVAGTYHVTVTATDSIASVSSSATFTWTVGATVVTVVNPGPQHNLTTDTLSLQIQASDSAPGQTLSYAATGLPGGLTIGAATGLISGTPALANTTVTVTVTDLAGSHTSVTFTWVVTNPSGPIVTVVNPGNQTSTQFKALTPLQISATDSAGNAITFTASGLPAGLGISASGLITGTPATAGTSTVTITGTDSALATGQATFTWVVNAPVVTVSNPGNQQNINGEVISLQFTATDTSGSVVTFSATGLPTGLAISAAGLVSGTISAAGTFATIITGTDGHGVTGTASFTWATAATTVTVTQLDDQINNVGDVVSVQLSAIDSSDNTLAWSAAGLPFPLIIDPGSGLITGSPQTPGTYPVVITATDNTASVSGTMGFTWLVNVATPVLAISLAPQAGTDIFGNKYPAGVTVGSNPSQRATITPAGLFKYSAPIIHLGSGTAPMLNGWGISNGHATIQVDAFGDLVISWKIMRVGTVTDGTAIWPKGTLPRGYRPSFRRRLACYTDVPATGKGPALELEPDGSVQCFGIGATATRVELYVTAPIFVA